MMGRQKLRSDLTAELIKHNTFDLPESMILNYMHNMRREKDHAEGREHTHDHGDHEHDYTDEERTAAIRQLKGYLLIEAVSKKVGIEISDDEFQEHLAERAERMGVDLEQLKRSARVEEFRRELRESKVFDHLAEKAKVKEESI